MMPEDPIILLSYVNQQLRDRYSSYEEMCEDLEWDSWQLIDRLGCAGFSYKEEINQFG